MIWSFIAPWYLNRGEVSEAMSVASEHLVLRAPERPLDLHRPYLPTLSGCYTGAYRRHGASSFHSSRSKRWRCSLSNTGDLASNETPAHRKRIARPTGRSGWPEP